MKLWIARNEDLRLLIFPCKPNAMEINPDKFPEVTFKNSPRKIEIKLVD
jgi:hypothetical protein